MEAVSMDEQIGQTAGLIWNALNGKGELNLAKLKKEIGGNGLLFDWAIGWLAREDKILLVPSQRSFRVRLKDAPVSVAAA